jgi:hypothetical protein
MIRYESSYFLLFKSNNVFKNKANDFHGTLFKATFNNISVYRGGQFFLVEETRVPGENHRPAASH